MECSPVRGKGVVLSALTGRLGIATSPSCRILAVNTMIKTELLFPLCYFCSYLSCLSYLQNGSRRVKGSGGVLNAAGYNTTDGFWLWMVDRCSIWPVTKEFRCGRAGENALPLGNSTTTHSFLMPPTHMCTFSCAIPANRNWLCLEEMAFYDSDSTGMGSFGN